MSTTTNEKYISVKKNCLGYHDGGCAFLNALYCQREICKFFKTQEMKDKQLQKIRIRLPDYEREVRREECL